MRGRIASVLHSAGPARRRAVRSGLIAAGAIVAFLAGIMAVLPFYVEGDAAKDSIEQQLSALTGGEFRYATLEFHSWPRPTADVRQISFRVALVDGTAERALLRFALLPLLKGELRVSKLELERPAAVARFPAFDSAPLSDPLAAYRAAITPTLAWLTVHAGGLEVSIRDGRAALHHGGNVPVELEALTLDGEVSDDAVTATIAARGNSWKRARASVNIATASQATTLELAVDELDADAALLALLRASSFRLHPAAADATLLVQTDGERSMTAALSVATPALALARDAARVDLGAVQARLKASYTPGDSSLTVEELALGDWLADGSGNLKVTRAPAVTALEAKAARVDAGRVRATLMTIFPDAPEIGAVLAIVKGGSALDVRVVGLGDDLSALADLRAYDMSMNVEKASFDVPVPPMELAATSGTLRIAKGVLDARNVAARFGASKLSNGELILALAPSVALVSLATAVDLDLAESRTRALYLSRGTAFGAELERIQSLGGRAVGTIKLREEGGRLRESYDLTNVSATLRHPGVPLPIAIDGGRFWFETGGALVLRGVSGAIGASRIQTLDAEVAFPSTSGPVVQSASGAATLSLEELTPWIVASSPPRGLRGEVSALQGAIDVKLARAAGPLAAPERLELSATMAPRRVSIATSHLQDNIALHGGTLRLENADLFFDGVDVEIQDARGVLTGSAKGYATPGRTLDLAFARTTLGPRGLERLEEELGIGSAARLQGPLTLERARIRWPLPAPWSLEASAAASFRNGGRAELELVSRPGQVNVRRLVFKDQDSDARIVVDWQTDRAVVGYHGVLAARSIARMFATPIAASGTLRGDFDATLDFRQPALSRANGKIEGADVVLPGTFDAPLAIGRLTVDADGERLRVRDTVLRFGDDPLRIDGSIARANGHLELDATVEAEGVNAEQWLAKLDGARGSATAPPWWRSLYGRIALRARHVDLGAYRMEPFVASLLLGENRVSAEVTDGSICGIAVPLTLTANAGALQLNGRATAKALPLATAATCLSKGRLSASGTVDVSAEFSSSGSPSSLIASSKGSGKLRARDGRIGGVNALSRVVEVDEVSARLPRTEVDSARESFAFSRLEIDASLVGKRLSIERALVASAALNVAMQGEVRLDDGRIALTGVALPIVNNLLQSVPVIGNVVGDPVVGIPISVTGDISDPRVSRAAAGAIAGALVGTLQSIVSLPVQLLGGGPAP